MQQNSYKKYSISENPDEIATANPEQELQDILNDAITCAAINNDKPNEENFVKKLCLYIRKNPNSSEEIIKKIAMFYNEHAEISHKIIISSVDSILSLLSEGSQIINFLNVMLPILVKSVYSMNMKISVIETYNESIGKLIKAGGTFTRQLIENYIDFLFNKFADESRCLNNENTKFAMIDLLTKIIENSQFFAFNKITQKTYFENFLKVMRNFKDKKLEVRYATGQLILRFIQMFEKREVELKEKYVTKVFQIFVDEFTQHMNETDKVPNNVNLISGFFIILSKFHEAGTHYFKQKEDFIKICDNIFNCVRAKSSQIKVEFIKFIPTLRKMNSELFRVRYSKNFLDYANTLLSIKTQETIRNSLLNSLGQLSYDLEIDKFESVLDNLFSLIKVLIEEKEVYDQEIFKCLSDLLENQTGIYKEKVIKNIKIFDILSKFFKQKITPPKMQFLLSVTDAYFPFSKEHVATIIVSLNVVSFFIVEEDFALNYFLSSNTKNSELISPQLEKILSATKKYTKKIVDKIIDDDISMNKNKKKNQKCKIFCDQNFTISLLHILTLITDNLFLKDIFFFYNQKIIPLLPYAPPKVKKKIIELSSSKFVKFYRNERSLSNFILQNILDSFRNVVLSPNEIFVKITIFKTLIENEIFQEALLAKPHGSFSCKLLGIFTGHEELVLKELFIELIGKLAEKTHDINYFIVFIRKSIENCLFNITFSDDLILKEDQAKLLLQFCVYLKKLFSFDLILMIIEKIIFLCLTYNRGSIKLNCMKIMSEICKIRFDKTVKSSEFVDKLFSDKAREYSRILLMVVINNLKDETFNSNNTTVYLKSLLHLVQIYELDIYEPVRKKSFFELKLNLAEEEGLRKVENNINANFTLAQLLLECILKSVNDESLSIILEIFGIAGSLTPAKLKNKLIKSDYFPYQDGRELLTYFNKRTRTFQEIETANIDGSTLQSVVSLMKILKENKQYELSTKILTYLGNILKALSASDSNIIDVILPVLIRTVPKFEINYQKSMFENMLVILSNFKEKFRDYLDDFVKILLPIIADESYIELYSSVVPSLLENFPLEMVKYYLYLIPIFTSLIKKNPKEIVSIIKCFCLMAVNSGICQFLDIILIEFEACYYKCKNDLVVENLNFIEKLSELENTFLYYHLIIPILLRKLEKVINDSNTFFKTKVINKTVNIFIIMNKKNRRHFISFLPLILKQLKDLGVLKNMEQYNKIRNNLVNYWNYPFISKQSFLEKLSEQSCRVNCTMGYNPFAPKAAYNPISTYNESNEHLIPQPKSRKFQIDPEQIIGLFDSKNCMVEEDWKEWFKTTTKMLFENSPSYALYYCHMVGDYYLPLVIDLYNYAFYSVYTSTNDQNKVKFTNSLQTALNNATTPNDVLLAILNLAEFITRKGVDECFVQNDMFSRVAYKCRAYAKALYYKESEFASGSDCGIVEDLIKLYYELNLPESVKGVLKFSEKNLRKKRDNYFLDEEEEKEDKYNALYNSDIQLHKYQDALKIISDELRDEDDREKKRRLQRDYNQCLKGLCDWEGILDSNKSQSLDIRSKGEDNEEVKDYVEKELLLTQAALNLGEWDLMKMHFEVIGNVLLQKDVRFDDDDANVSSSNVNENVALYERLYDYELSPDYSNENEQNFMDNHGMTENNLNNIKPSTKFDSRKISNASSNKVPNVKKAGFSNSKVPLFTKSRQSINNTNIQLDKINYYNFSKISLENKQFKFLLNNDQKIFNLNLYGCILGIYTDNYVNATKYLNSLKKMVCDKVRSLLAESYPRAYKLFLQNQMTYCLEEIIEYKQRHGGDENYRRRMVEKWDKNLAKKVKDPVYYEHFLSIRSLVLTVEEDVDHYIELSRRFRKMSLYAQCEKVLERVRKHLCMDEPVTAENFDEIRAKVELQYLQCLFEKGEHLQAFSKSAELLRILEDGAYFASDDFSEGSNDKALSLSDKIKSKIYSSYAIAKQKQYFLDNYNGSFRSIKHSLEKRDSDEKNVYRCFRSLNKYNTSSYGEAMAQRFNEEDVVEINHYFMKSTGCDNDNYKTWHQYAMFNYKYFKLLEHSKENAKEAKSEICRNNSDKELNFIYNETRSEHGYAFAKNAIRGFKQSLSIGGKNMNKTFQDLLRLLDLLYNVGSHNDDALRKIEEAFYVIDIDSYLNVMSQLTSRLDVPNIKVLEVLIKLLIKVGAAHPRPIVVPLLVLKHSKSKARRTAAMQILDGIGKAGANKRLIDEQERFILELNRVSLLLHEQWYETIEEAGKDFLGADYSSMLSKLLNLSETLKRRPSSVYERNFFQTYRSELREAEQLLRTFIKTASMGAMKSAWEIYHLVYIDIGQNWKTFEKISLEYASPWLSKYKNGLIDVPGLYVPCLRSKIKDVPLVRNISDELSVFNTKQHPRKLTIFSNEDKQYMFLLKGHEDLRQDERAMQLFHLVNTLLCNDRETKTKDLAITTYMVAPLSRNTGIIGWVPNCDTINQLIKEHRSRTMGYVSLEHRRLKKLHAKFESATFLSKVEIFKESLQESKGCELKEIIWQKSPNCESWLERRTNYSRSLAVMSMVGYILGLGDRHPSNLMMDRKTGKIIHIDFGDCFEIAMKREKFPEKVPFRLTRMLIKALEVAGIDGTFRIFSEHVMRILRANQDSLLAIFESFLHDPLVSFRLMIPVILKKKGGKVNNSNISNLVSAKQEEKNQKKRNHSPDSITISKKMKQYFSTFNKEMIESGKKKKLPKEDNDNIHFHDMKEDNEYNEEAEKNEKFKMMNEEKQIFNLYEERDEINNTEINDIAQFVIKRIHEKLTGTDFIPDVVYNVHDQVDRLIRQAISYENLAQSYLGWCPFW